MVMAGFGLVLLCSKGVGGKEKTSAEIPKNLVETMKLSVQYKLFGRLGCWATYPLFCFLSFLSIFLSLAPVPSFLFSLTFLFSFLFLSSLFLWTERELFLDELCKGRSTRRSWGRFTVVGSLV